MAGVSPLPAGWPTLSQLRSSQFGHLGQFADWCEHLGTKAESVLTQLAQKVRAPGGVEWEGEAGDAAITQADTDVATARPFLWSMPDAGEIARRGKEMLQAGKQEALEAVGDAQRAGFRVGEDYSVIDTRQATSGAQQEKRLAEAIAHSNFIRHRVGMLVGKRTARQRGAEGSHRRLGQPDLRGIADGQGTRVRRSRRNSAAISRHS